jgi:hypothetical protein
LTYHQPPTANNDNYDLLTEANRIKTQPTIDVVCRWVEGHQVEHYDNRHRDKYGLLNDAMDKLAKWYLKETKDRNSPSQQIVLDHEWSVWIDNRKITGDTLNTVWKHIQETEMSVACSRQKTWQRNTPQSPRSTVYLHYCRRLEGHHVWTKELAYKNESKTRTSWVEYAQMGVLD